MRVYVKTVNAINPTDFSQCGAVYVDEPENFMNWMARYCPSSFCSIADNMRPGSGSAFKEYIRFSLPNVRETKVFIDKWGSHREKVD